MKVIHFIEFFQISIIFHTKFFDLKSVKSIKQIEQSDTRPKTAENKCLKKQEIFKNYFPRKFYSCFFSCVLFYSRIKH